MTVEVLVRSRPSTDDEVAPAPVSQAPHAENAPRLRSLVIGMICGLVGAVLATGAFSTGLLYNDLSSVLSVAPLIATLIAVVCALVAAMGDLVA